MKIPNWAKGKKMEEYALLWNQRASQVVLVKEPACQCRKCKRHGFDPWVGKISWKRAWKPTPVLLPGERLGQRSLAGYSLWDPKESSTTEHQHAHTESRCHQTQTCPPQPPAAPQGEDLFTTWVPPGEKERVG